ncbi:MAG: hypothetical protein AVDCRST_MAG80-1036, partial [uncultured Rubrobacteraceae bacterium]
WREHAKRRTTAATSSSTPSRTTGRPLSPKRKARV